MTTQKDSAKKLRDLESEFQDDAVTETKSIQNQTLGVSGRPTPAQRKMQVVYDPEEPIIKPTSDFVDGYSRLVADTNTNMQALYESILPMNVTVMSHRSLGDTAINTNNENMNMISNQFGMSIRSQKTEKKAKKFRRIDSQVNW